MGAAQPHWKEKNVNEKSVKKAWKSVKYLRYGL